MDEWSSVLQSGKVNSVRNPKQTCSAITVMAALFKLMGKVAKNCILVFVLNMFLLVFLYDLKMYSFYFHLICVLQPLKALRAYQLMLGVARQLADAHHCVTALTQSASILLDLGAPEPAMVFIVFYSTCFTSWLKFPHVRMFIVSFL